MGKLLLTPPIAFVIVLLASASTYLALRIFTLRRKGAPEGLTRPYACGEEISDRFMMPDYGQFFPFAFFFTILHVVAMMTATVPAEVASAVVMVALYIIGAAVGLTVLYRK